MNNKSWVFVLAKLRK